jgi:hypothetical protein
MCPHAGGQIREFPTLGKILTVLDLGRGVKHLLFVKDAHNEYGLGVSFQRVRMRGVKSG